MREQRDRPAAPAATAVAKTPRTRPIAEALKPRSWPRIGTRKRVHVPARREQPVDEQEPREAGRLQQVPGVARWRCGGGDGGARLDRHEARPAPGWPAAAARARRRRAESRSGRSAFRRRTGPTTFDERRREAEPAEDALAGSVGSLRHPSGRALDRDQAEVGAGAGETSRRRRARRTGRAGEAAVESDGADAADRRSSATATRIGR